MTFLCQYLSKIHLTHIADQKNCLSVHANSFTLPSHYYMKVLFLPFQIRLPVPVKLSLNFGFCVSSQTFFPFLFLFSVLFVFSEFFINFTQFLIIFYFFYILSIFLLTNIFLSDIIKLQNNKRDTKEKQKRLQRRSSQKGRYRPPEG